MNFSIDFHMNFGPLLGESFKVVPGGLTQLVSWLLAVGSFWRSLTFFRRLKLLGFETCIDHGSITA